MRATMVKKVIESVVRVMEGDADRFEATDTADLIAMVGQRILDGLAAHAPDPTAIEIGSILSHRTKEGAVELTVNGETTQMDIAKAREVSRMLEGAIEAAVSDQLMFQFLATRIGLSPEAAGAALLEFREMRQGSRATVHPS